MMLLLMSAHYVIVNASSVLLLVHVNSVVLAIIYSMGTATGLVFLLMSSPMLTLRVHVSLNVLQVLMEITKHTLALQSVPLSNMVSLQPIYAQCVHLLALCVQMQATVLLASLQLHSPLIICVMPTVTLLSDTPTMAHAGIAVLVEHISPIPMSYAQHAQPSALPVLEHPTPAPPVQAATTSTPPVSLFVHLAISATQPLCTV